jgi:hypothetical protein
MKRAGTFLILLAILAIGCREDGVDEIQSLKDGEFVINLYHSNGSLLLTTKGNAENLSTSGSHWEIRLMDPDFSTPNPDPLETFAHFTIIGQSAIAQPGELSINNDNIAIFHQRWYSITGDWGYRSTSGTLHIQQLEKLRMKGSFEINLEVDQNAQQHPEWGDRILVKGNFSSVCPYQETGGCK